MSSILPKYVGFMSQAENWKFLRYKNDMTETNSLVQFAEVDVMNPYAQFEVVESEIGGGLVHIKCRCNDLYLVRWSRSHYWISASAYGPQEDKTSWACTLFKPILFGNNDYGKMFRLLHVQSERYVRPSSSSVSAPYVSCLLADSKEPDHTQNEFDILVAHDMIYWSKLPRRVAFLGDNVLFLGAHLFDGRPGLQFSFKDYTDPKVAHQLITFPDGTISVKSEYYESFWRVERDIQNNYIVVDADGPNPNAANNSDTGTFRVKRIDEFRIGLLSMNTTSYLKRMDGPDIGWENSIGAASHNIDPSACIRFIELNQVNKLQETTDLPTI